MTGLSSKTLSWDRRQDPLFDRFPAGIFLLPNRPSSGFSLREEAGEFQPEEDPFFLDEPIPAEEQQQMEDAPHEVVQTFDEGVLVEEATFEYGVLHGPLRRYEDELLVEELNFVNGKLHGEARFFDENGELSQHLEFVGGKLSGTCTIFESGCPVLVQEMQDGVAHGVTKSLENGVALTECGYAKGLQHGSSISRRPNGTLMCRSTFVEGRREGLTRLFDDQEKQVRIEPYKADKINGETFDLDSQGKILRRQSYKNGKLDGWTVSFTADGEEIERLFYVADKFADPDQAENEPPNADPPDMLGDEAAYFHSNPKPSLMEA